MRRAARAKQFDLFNTPANTPLSASQALRAELVSLLRALLLEVVPARECRPIITEEES